jgi:hypothetical protein
VDETTWRSCTDPWPALAFLRGKISDRKLRLFACACVRRVWPLLTDERSWKAVEIAEEYWDGRPDRVDAEEVLAEAQSAAGELHQQIAQARTSSERRQRQAAAMVANGAASTLQEIGVWGLATPAWLAAREVSSAAATAIKYLALANGAAGRPAAKKERASQCQLLRDLFGPLPFRAVPIDPAWLVWSGRTVEKLTASVYEGRAFERMPILADALEEAGCTNGEILGHCRGPGPHTRGCWVIDSLSGRQ